MSVKFIYQPVSQEAWDAFRKMPLKDLRGQDGLFDASTYELWTPTQIRVGSTELFPDSNGAPWGLVSLALGISGYLEALESCGRFDDLSISAAAGTPDLVAEVRGETVVLATYAAGMPSERTEPLRLAVCTREEFRAAVAECSACALADLRAGMTGDYAAILEQWMTQVSRPRFEPPERSWTFQYLRWRLHLVRFRMSVRVGWMYWNLRERFDRRSLRL